jgi:hypothetical protein
MYTLSDQLALSTKAYEALQRIKSRSNEKTTEELMQEARTNLDYSRQIFEEYTDEKFFKKIEMDSHIYNQFLKNTEDNNIVQHVQENLSNYLATIRAIYEHINIEPKIYGFKQLNKNSSEIDLVTEAKKIIFEHLDKSYYNLSSSERQKKYKDFVVSSSHDIAVTENLDIDDSVEHVYKAAVINSLLENINFPFIIKSKVEELLESQIYKEVFDVDKLQDLWENFHEQSFKLSRIFSLLC